MRRPALLDKPFRSLRLAALGVVAAATLVVSLLVRPELVAWLALALAVPALAMA